MTRGGVRLEHTEDLLPRAKVLGVCRLSPISTQVDLHRSMIQPIAECAALLRRACSEMGIWLVAADGESVDVDR